MKTSVSRHASDIRTRLHRNHFSHTPLTRLSRVFSSKTLSGTRTVTDALHASLRAAQMKRVYSAAHVNAIRSITQLAGDDLSVLEDTDAETTDRYNR